MEIKFFNKDAREIFLESKSVDLFVSYPPFYKKAVTEYGGDISLQLQNAYNIEEFFDSLVKVFQHMEYALSDTGNIVLIFPNNPKTFRTIVDIMRSTDLIVNQVLFWDFEDMFEAPPGDGTHLIFHITRMDNIPCHLHGIDSFVFKNPYGPHYKVFENYNHMGFLSDSLPEALTDILVSKLSKEGDTVADILGGTGTVAVSSIKNKRKAIYNDSSIVQYEIAKKRVGDIVIETEEKSTTQEKDIDMTKEETMQLMLKSINDDNRDLCQKNGMSESDAEAQISQSQPALQHIVANMYDRMKAAGLVA